MLNKTRVRPLRGERRSRPLPVAPLFALAILAVGIAYAQQNLPAPTAAPAKAPASSQPPAAESVPEPAPDAAAPAAAATAATEDAPQAAKPTSAPAAARGSPQRFEPTEKVRPDFDVAFPVDI
jgi:hypothetical protein